MPQAPHDAAFEREWATLRRKLQLAQGFCFIVYFVDDERPALEIKSRLRDTLTFSTSHLVEISVDAPSELASKSLAAVFEAADLEVHRDVHAPFWLEAFRGRGDPAWDEARVELLMRLNERRSRLEAEVRCPLILLLPAGSQREAASRAPDMWHIRVHSAVLAWNAATVDGMAEVPAAGRQSAPDAVGALPREAVYWNEQVRKAGGLASLSLWDGFAAVDALLEHGAWQEAGRVAREVLLLARERAAGAGGAERNDALRDLSVSLNKVGDTEAAAGRSKAALAAYRESLALRRELRSALGDAPQALRDLSVSLNKVGDAEAVAGGGEEALAAYRESLALACRLRSALGDAPQALRDLSVSLERVGDAEIPATTSTCLMTDR